MFDTPNLVSLSGLPELSGNLVIENAPLEEANATTLSGMFLADGMPIDSVAWNGLGGEVAVVEVRSGSQIELGCKEEICDLTLR